MKRTSLQKFNAWLKPKPTKPRRNWKRSIAAADDRADFLEESLCKAVDDRDRCRARIVELEAKLANLWKHRDQTLDAVVADLNGCRAYIGQYHQKMRLVTGSEPPAAAGVNPLQSPA
jgi:hypothetical protein